MKRLRACGLGLIAFIAGFAYAAPLPLANTGYSGSLLPDGAIDPNYTLIDSADPSFAGPAAFVTNDTYPIPPWSAVGPDSRWISPRPDAGNDNSGGNYTYRYTFSLSGFDPATAHITGTWATDNAGLDILLNGVSISPAPTSPISFIQPLGTYTFDVPVAGNFNACSNTLDFVLNNSGGPTGLRVELSGTAAANSPIAVAAAFAPPSIPVGAGSTFTLTLVNASGNSSQSCLGFDVALASGLSFSGPVSAAQCGGSVSTAGNVLSLANGSLAAGSSSCTISADVTSSIPGAYVENDAASINARAGNLDTTAVDTTLLVTGLADLSTTATIPASTVAGATVSIPLLLSNNGPSAAINVAISATLPAGLSNVVTFGGGSYNSATGAVTWPIVASLGSGTSLGYSVNYKAPGAGGVSFSATLSSATTDPDGTNNTVSGTTAVSLLSDVSVSAVIPASVVAGSTLTVPLTVTNSGPSTASNVAVSAGLPAASNGVVVSNSGAYNSSTGAITWPAVATLSSGATLNYSVSYTAPGSGTVPFSSSVSSSTSDASSANNAVSGTTVISTVADVSLAANIPGVAIAGTTVTIPVAVTNGGPSPASNVTISALLSTGLSGVTVSNGGVYNGVTGTIAWPVVASLANGATLDYSVAYTVPASGSVAFSATVSSATSDSNAANNSAGAATPIRSTQAVVVDTLTPIGLTMLMGFMLLGASRSFVRADLVPPRR